MWRNLLAILATLRCQQLLTAAEEVGLIQKKTTQVLSTGQWRLKRPPKAPVDILLSDTASVQRYENETNKTNETEHPNCFEHDCDYWAASGYSCEVLQDYYQCDCTGSACALDIPSCSNTCNGHSCDFWAILHGMRCQAAPLDSCDCTGCRCINDDVHPTEAPVTTAEPTEDNTTMNATDPEETNPSNSSSGAQDATACEMCGAQDCDYWVQNNLFDCVTLMDSYGCSCHNCESCGQIVQPQPPEVFPMALTYAEEPAVTFASVKEMTAIKEQGCRDLCHTKTCDDWVTDGLFTCDELKKSIFGCSCSGCKKCPEAEEMLLAEDPVIGYEPRALTMLEPPSPQVNIAPHTNHNRSNTTTLAPTTPGAIPPSPEVTSVPTVPPSPEVTSVPTLPPTTPEAVPPSPEVTSVPTVPPSPEVTSVPTVPPSPEVTSVPTLPPTTPEAIPPSPEVTRTPVPTVSTSLEVTSVPTVPPSPEVTSVPTVPPSPEVTSVPTVPPSEVTSVPTVAPTSIAPTPPVVVTSAAPTFPPVDPVVSSEPATTTVLASTTTPSVTPTEPESPEACRVCQALGKSCDEMYDLGYSCNYITHNWGCDCNRCNCALDKQVCPKTCGSGSVSTGGETPDCNFWVKQGYSCSELEQTYGCICGGCSMCS